uniref:Uncharacterized protein n=1 Tax=Romanomermis culicivorax TaxID=13658 RepID=A0A915IHF7_ROMCU
MKKFSASRKLLNLKQV